MIENPKKKKYNDDIGHEKNLENEFNNFRELCKKTFDKKTISEMFAAVHDVKATIPNNSTLLEIYMTIPVSNASGERSFSVLKRIKNYLRSSIGPERLDGLSILYIENEVFEKLDCNDLIQDFALVLHIL